MRRKQFDRTACFEITETMERQIDAGLGKLRALAPETYKSRSDFLRAATAMMLYALDEWHPGAPPVESATVRPPTKEAA